MHAWHLSQGRERMPAPELCIPVVWTLCERPEAWSVWAAFLQALLAGAAIFFAARLATRQERRAVARRTEVFLERIKQAATQAGRIKTFFGIVPNEEPRDLVYGAQRKLFEQFAQSLRAVPLENVVDSRLLMPLHNAATSCEIVAELLGNEPPRNGSAELKVWFKKLGEAQFQLFECYNTAYAVHVEFAYESFAHKAARRFLRWKISRSRKKN